jgi:uncharacterized protein YndB with AHSA1/START domain
MFPLAAVELDFLATAPQRFEYAEPVHAPPAAVFAAISADPGTWSWFPGLEDGGYEGDGPAGVGSGRWVCMEGVVYRETVLAWDEPHRWAYRVDASSAPVFATLLEDWVIEPAGEGTSTLRWTFAFEPRPEMAEVMIGAQRLVGDTFRAAVAGLNTALV